MLFFKGDCLRVSKKINATKENDPVLSLVMQDINCLLGSNPCWKVKCICREANMITHVLAKLALFVTRENMDEGVSYGCNSLVLKEKQCS